MENELDEFKNEPFYKIFKQLENKTPVFISDLKSLKTENAKSFKKSNKIDYINFSCEFIEKDDKVVHDNFIFDKDTFFDFLNNSFEFILSEAGNEINLIGILNRLGNLFLDYYGLRRNSGDKYLKTSFVQINLPLFMQIYKFIEKTPKFYIKTNSAYENAENHIIGLKTWFEKGITKTTEEIILNGILDQLNTAKSKTLTIKNLTFLLNVTITESGIPKPFNEEFVKKVLLKNEDMFITEDEYETIKIKDRVKYYSEILLQNQVLLTNFDLDKKSGFIAFFYVGEQSLLEEFDEYIKTRSILFLATIENSKIILKLINDGSLDKKESNDSEFIKYLLAILPSDVNMKNWLLQNISVSFCESSLEDQSLYTQPLIKELSPIFNVKNNPGNLFQFTLEDKLEEYSEKNS